MIHVITYIEDSEQIHESKVITTTLHGSTPYVASGLEAGSLKLCPPSPLYLDITPSCLHTNNEFFFEFFSISLAQGY